MALKGETAKEYFKKYYIKNKEEMNSKTVKRRQDNKETYLKYQYKYSARRMQDDPKFKLMSNMRKRVCKVLKSKSSKTLTILGCSAISLKAYLEAQFHLGMTWENYGKWHVDHIMPLSSAKNEEELIKLCHYSNLQPLWAKDNLSKSDKMPVKTQS